jgi:hypothetical protein
MPQVGARAVAVLTELAGARAGGPIGVADSGTLLTMTRVEFSQTAESVDVQATFSGCQGRGYPVRILDTADCGDVVTAKTWDGARGDGIGIARCTGRSGVGLLYYSRLNGDPKPWTVGGDPASDIVGRALVLYTEDGTRPIDCGIIQREAVGEREAGTSGNVNGVSLEVRAVVAGLCFGQAEARTSTVQCPDPQTIVDCATAHCDLDACVAKCPSYAACTAMQADPCANPLACSADSDDCVQCLSTMLNCTALGFCAKDYLCADAPTPGGPCTQLEACCKTQGDRAQSCLDTIHLLESYNGDTGCYDAEHDWDVITHMDPPCVFTDAGFAPAP